MTEEDDHSDFGQEGPKTSKRNLFKGAIARTKTKFKKQDKSEEQEHKLSDDVSAFLAAGRPSSSSRPSVSDSISYGSDRPSTSDSFPRVPSPLPPTDGSIVSPPQSPRRIIVPRIDVSNSQRWPNAHPVESRDVHGDTRLLRPEYQERSRSANSYSTKKRGRIRGLSVTFREDPPVIIGEGGDEAETPPVEISRARARARARSESPMSNRPQPYANTMVEQRPFIKRKPVINTVNRTSPGSTPESFQPRPIQRVQTGVVPTTPVSKLAFDREFEMSLNLGAGPSPESPVPITPLHAPKPIRPPVPIPQVKEPPNPSHSLKQTLASNDLRMQFEEGEALRKHNNHQRPSDSDSDEGHIVQEQIQVRGKGSNYHHQQDEYGMEQQSHDFASRKKRPMPENKAYGNWI